MMTKICNKCQLEKSLAEFSFRLSGRGAGKPRSRCKKCEAIATQEYYMANAERIKEKRRKYSRDNRASENESRRAWRKKNPQSHRDEVKWYKKEHPEWTSAQRRKYELKKLRTDSNYRLKKRIRSYVVNVLSGRKKAGKTFELVGCSLVELRKHLESQFKLGMTWENYGPVWHVDHIRPCASFDLSDPEQQKQCFHYTNLQPLWAADNLSKGDKWPLTEALKMGTVLR